MRLLFCVRSFLNGKYVNRYKKIRTEKFCAKIILPNYVKLSDTWWSRWYWNRQHEIVCGEWWWYSDTWHDEEQVRPAGMLKEHVVGIAQMRSKHAHHPCGQTYAETLIQTNSRHEYCSAKPWLWNFRTHLNARGTTWKRTQAHNEEQCDRIVSITLRSIIML